ncbi:MAG: hypothetical protein MHPSP_001779, partial [Paramarteilia canceri]
MASFSLSCDGYQNAILFITNHYSRIPILILGGGGYNATECAKCWTKILARLSGQEIQNNIPFHDFIELYSPSYELSDTLEQEIKSINK